MTRRFCAAILPALLLVVGPGSSQSQVTEQNLGRFLKDSRSQAEGRRVLGAEIEKLFRDDQAQGSPEFMSGEKLRVWEADHEKRILRMREIVRTEPLETIPDLYNAGLLLQHGIAAEDFLAAHVLFTAAAVKGSTSARWAAAASLERYLGWTGRPFIFHTGPGRPNLLTDELRDFYCMLPVAEQRSDSQNRTPRPECRISYADVYNDGQPHE